MDYTEDNRYRSTLTYQKTSLKINKKRTLNSFILIILYKT